MEGRTKKSQKLKEWLEALLWAVVWFGAILFISWWEAI